MSRTKHHTRTFRRMLRWGHFERKRDRRDGFRTRAQKIEKLRAKDGEA